MNAEQLRNYVGASISDADYIEECLNTATILVQTHIGRANVPSAVLDMAYLQTASELYHRRQAPNGIAQFAAFDGAPIRVARDPMASTYSLLAPYLVGGV